MYSASIMLASGSIMMKAGCLRCASNLRYAVNGLGDLCVLGAHR